MNCLVHYEDVQESGLANLTEQNFATLKLCAQQWVLLEGKEKEISEKRSEQWNCSLSTLCQTYGFHRRCYGRFTNKVNINRRVMAAERRKQLLEESANSGSKTVSSSPTSKRKVLRSSSIHHKPQTSETKSSHLFPMVCIICGKKEKNLTKAQQKHYRKKKDRLQLAVTKDAGV